MLKRSFDVVTSGAALLLLALPMSVIVVILRLTGEGQVWYTQERVGLGGKRFSALKFATMRIGSETMASGRYTLRDDPRVLPVGKVLRKTKLNELPQLLNVLRGDMSVVGWRPVEARSFIDYPEHVKEELVEVRPGLTGIGSLVFRDEEAIVTRVARSGADVMKCYREDIKPYKGELELWYKKHRTFWLDVKIIVATVWMIVHPGGASYRRWFKGIPEPSSPLIREHMGLPSDTVSDQAVASETMASPRQHHISGTPSYGDEDQ